MGGHDTGSPYAPHTPTETEQMLDAVGVATEADLFDIPEPVRFDGELGIEPRSEQAVRQELGAILGRNDDLTEFLGRGHYDHYVPSLVDHLSDRQEFLSSYTQYQPEIAQGFLQALFEYQSMLVELTGLEVANCSLYDAATALGETATLASRVRATTGDRVLVPGHLPDGTRGVLENYADGADLAVESYPMDDGVADVEAIRDLVDDDLLLLYAESPTVRGVIEESLDDLGAIADEHEALFALGSDPVALSVLEEPAAAGADVVIGDAATLGMGTSYGMGLGMFATRKEFLRQVPGRLVGASEDSTGRRAFTLTLQTREQHIRRERATSNICTNQAWVALRTAIHAAYLGPEGLIDLARTCITGADRLADGLDDVTGISAPVHDRHHFREFLARTDQPAPAIASELTEEGYAVHAVDDHLIQCCVTDTNVEQIDGLVEAVTEVVA
ncbi:aminomethyl-transferring glycine dehydrogenase subunit GcvPA [Halovenus sp. WSH3]|uniref:Aminomethyl-transferring glycine dehydrogenase subunit GcvPA n=1 Tax=Halovenus carboxidivorans TaxID=2692199 RepID=A0A6B0T6Z2_9EURY|nr:aminomethyl-transferring glycine dehydrogenase subunit GcvPA [Halovenus carboxidivorans]MXR51976.1 aminomethyl-transferring glycine dehydrogenase subunit GcvPA [Halovenus carboxidivorans]